MIRNAAKILTTTITTGVLVILIATMSTSAAAQDQQFTTPEIPIDERALMRAYAQWWMAYTRRQTQEESFHIADSAFERGNMRIARNNYRVLATYGDKFAQFRMGLIALEENDPTEAWAWFELAAEDGVQQEFAPFPDQVWNRMNNAQREHARARRAELARSYSDLALAARMEKIFRNQERSITGSRTGYVGNLINDRRIDPDLFFEQIGNGLTFASTFLDRYGNVTLRDFEVIEPEDERAPVDEG